MATTNTLDDLRDLHEEDLDDGIVEDEIEDEIEDVPDTEVDVEETDVVEDEVTKIPIETEDPLEADEDETDEQAMSVAQRILVQKQQATLSQANVYRKYYTTKKVSAPYITKFEKARLLSVRAQALESGSMPFVPIDDPNEDPYSIARREYDACRIPYFIVRKLPNQEKEYWRLSDFKSLVPLTSV